MQYLRTHVLLFLVCATVLLALVPLVESRVLIGSQWQGVVPVYMDEYIYYAYVSEAATGNLFFGHPYFLEHRFDPPLFLSGSVVLGALPLLLGLPLPWAVPLAFVVWSVVFVLLCYRLLRELSLEPLWSAGGALLAYAACYDQVYRIGVRQEVYPFLLLFYILLVRLVHEPGKLRAAVLGISAGVSFYLYGFLWQTVVVTLALAFAYAVVFRQWVLLRTLALSGVVAGAVAAPALLYAWWVSGQPYFWESLNRYGLVETHLPVAEVIYSGGWVAIALVVLGALYWRIKVPRVRTALVLVALMGAGIWIVQGSNVLSGKLLEQGDHLRRFITLWLPLATAACAYIFVRHQAQMPKALRISFVAAGIVLVCGSVNFAAHHTHPFTKPLGSVVQWQTQQTYAPVLAWLQEHEREPVVVWSNPHSFATVHIPVYTQHYVLYLEAGELALMSSKEIEERYLVSSYFENVDAEYLKKDLEQYVGRANAYHLPQTLERESLVCRLLHLGNSSCAPVRTPQQLLGETYFADLAKEFKDDIKPNIQEYLRKYHVSYVLKDRALDTTYRPETLGATEVYSDDHFQLYKLP